MSDLPMPAPGELAQVRSRTRRLRLVAVVSAVAYAAVVAGLVLSPSNADPQSLLNRISLHLLAHGVSPRIALHLEPLGNVALSVPLPVLITWALGGRPRWGALAWAGAAFVVFGGVEFVQDVCLPDRVASTTDVVTNTLGGLLGGVIVVLDRFRRRRLARPAGPIRAVTQRSGPS